MCNTKALLLLVTEAVALSIIKQFELHKSLNTTQTFLQLRSTAQNLIFECIHLTS